MTDFNSSQDDAKVLAETRKAMDTALAKGLVNFCKRCGRNFNDEVAEKAFAKLLEDLSDG